MTLVTRQLDDNFFMVEKADTDMDTFFPRGNRSKALRWSAREPLLSMFQTQAPDFYAQTSDTFSGRVKVKW